MLQISTAIAILGVDFEIFPRRFAKTKMYGISIMDTGTSMFVFAMGYGQTVFPHKDWHSWLYKTLLNFAVVTVLGCSKSFLVTLTGHHHEVTEYGVHWNFFVTLSCLIAFSFLPSFVRLMISLSLNISLIAMPMVQKIMMSDDRDIDSLIESNKEGIISLIGYSLIYELSCRFGDEIVKKYG